MANLIKQAVVALGRFTGLYQKSAQDPYLALIEPAEAIDATGAGADATDVFSDSTLAVEQSAADLPPLDAPALAWGEALGLANATTHSATDANAPDVTTADLSVVSVDSLSDAPAQPVEIQPLPAPAFVAALPEIAPVVIAAPAPVVVEEVKPPIELKPERPAAKPAVSFTQMYEMISTEINKRADSSVAAYERLLAATHDELDAARKSNRIAWSVGGVMTAVAAFGAIWAAGEVAATHVEVGNLRQQVVTGQQASLERDALRADLSLTREASAKVEIDGLKSRLDQALAVSADRDRLRTAEVDTLRKAKQEVESELRLARATAATQPVSSAQPAASKVLGDHAATATDKAAGSERPDVWSTLLNGRDER